MSFMFARRNIYLFDLLAEEERRQVFPGDAGRAREGEETRELSWMLVTQKSSGG